MLKKILMCFALLVVLTCTATADAKTIELTGIDVFDADAETLRIEISYKGGKLFDGDVDLELNGTILRVNLNNTLPGRISRVSGTQIQDDAKEFVNKILVNRVKEKCTRIQIQLSTDAQGTSFHIEPADSSEKKSARLVVDVKKGFAFNNDENSLNEDFDGGGRIVVIDPGHGGSDAGAIGPSGVSEKSVSLAVGLKTQKLLTANGYRVIMTRTTDIDVAAPGVSDATELQARVDKAPPNAALFISIHCNAFSNGNANGMETYHAPTAIQGRRLATLLNEELEKFGGLNNRGVKGARFYVMTHTKCPASLIELGFITNPREEKLLASSDYQQKLAQAITNAVNRYFQGGLD